MKIPNSLAEAVEQAKQRRLKFLLKNSPKIFLKLIERDTVSYAFTNYASTIENAVEIARALYKLCLIKTKPNTSPLDSNLSSFKQGIQE